MTEFLKSLISTINARMTNPLFGTFILSWSVINWKILLILLSSSMENKTKITEINKYLHISDTLLFPLLTALFLYFALPLIYYYFEKTFSNDVEFKRLEASHERVQKRHDLDNLEAASEKLIKVQTALDNALSLNNELVNNHTIEEDTHNDLILKYKATIEKLSSDETDLKNHIKNADVSQKQRDKSHKEELLRLKLDSDNAQSILIEDHKKSTSKNALIGEKAQQKLQEKIAKIELELKSAALSDEELSAKLESENLELLNLQHHTTFLHNILIEFKENAEKDRSIKFYVMDLLNNIGKLNLE